MADEEITADEIEQLLPPEVRAALAEEAEFIADRVRHAQGTWDKTLAAGLSWLPWVGDVFDENVINTAAATSDVNRADRTAFVVGKIEKAMNAKLGADTVESVRRLIEDMYNTNVNVDEL